MNKEQSDFYLKLRKKIASNSASVNAFGPRCKSFSLGRSSAGQSVIGIRFSTQ